MTFIKLLGLEEPYLVKEGFNTIRTRVAEQGLFFVATLENRKIVLSKSIVEMITPFVEADDEAAEALKKDDKKGKKVK